MKEQTGFRQLLEKKGFPAFLWTQFLGDGARSRADALLEMSTFVAIVMGTAIGSYLFTMWLDEPWKMGLITLAVAAVGLLTSLGIPRVAASGVAGPFRANPFGEVIT